MRTAGAFGVDVDRVGEPERIRKMLRRRAAGRFPVDPFGSDPLLHDAVARPAAGVSRLDVVGGERIPRIGPVVLLVARRRGVGDAIAVALAVHTAARRRARIVGYPDLPVLGGLARRLGAVRARADDLAGLLRAGHVAVVAKGDDALLEGAAGFPVIPVAVSGVFPGRRRVEVGR